MQLPKVMELTMNSPYRVVAAKVVHEQGTKQNQRSIIRKSIEVVADQKVRVKRKNEVGQRNARGIVVSLLRRKRNGIDVHPFDAIEEKGVVSGTETVIGVVVAEVQHHQDFVDPDQEVPHPDTDEEEHHQTGNLF